MQERFWTGPPHPVARALGEGDEVAGFTVLETPGHSPGHVSFWRESDRVLIVGDVLGNMNFITGIPGLNTPPDMFTPDPARNRESARRLAELRPALACFGHGAPLRDPGKLARVRGEAAQLRLDERRPVHPVRETGAVEPTEHARGPWDPRALHGGAPAALIARAFERTEPGAELPFARLGFEFLKPIPFAELEVATEIVRNGRRVQELAAELQGGRGDRSDAGERAANPGGAGGPARPRPAPRTAGSRGGARAAGPGAGQDREVRAERHRTRRAWRRRAWR